MDSFTYIIVYPNGSQRKVKAESVIEELYYKLARVPKKKELPKGVGESYILDLKKHISMRTEFIPLFDIHSKNIYIIEPNNLYIRIAKHDFRVPDKETIKLIESQIIKYNKIIAKYKGKDVPVYYTYYLEQLNKHINFLNNYDLPTLRNTFYKAFYNNNPSIRDLTSCRRPSFYPSLRNKPYYTKTEIVNMSLNLNLKVNMNDLNDMCQKIADNDISAKILNEHMIFIEKNNATSFVQLYTFIGSSHMNSYLRYEHHRDIYLENNIFAMWSLMKKAPEFDKKYYLYRFVDNIDYLKGIKVGDIYEERSFISTTRNPFYNPKNNIFGYNLIKINIPKGKPGIALCLETASFFQEEEEILLAPGRLQLVSVDDHFVYYHPNETAQNRIQRKFEFVYLNSFDDSPLLIAKNYPQKKYEYVHIDFTKIKLNGEDVKQKINYFFNDVVTRVNNMRYFTTNIGSKKYTFQVYYREDLRAYDKYFFIQKPDHMYWILQNELTKEIEMYVEIREKISVNFIFRFIGGISPFNNEDFLLFLSYVSLCFNINEVIIHDDYINYTEIANRILSDNKLSPDLFLHPDTHIQQVLSAKYKFYPKDVLNFVISKGNYLVGDIDKTYTPRFNLDSIQPFFKKDDIMELAETKTTIILNTKENNPITRIYLKFFKQYQLDKALDFYIYLHFHYFYLIRIFNKYLKKYYEKLLRPTNLWDTTFYIFNPLKYMRSKGLIEREVKEVNYEAVPDTQKSRVTKKIRESVEFY